MDAKLLVEPEVPVGPVGRLLDRPERWTQFALCRDADGIPCGFDQSPVSYCVVGAIRLKYGSTDEWEAALDKLAQAAGVVRGGNGGLVDWNNAKGRTFEQVRAAVLKAGV